MLLVARALDEQLVRDLGPQLRGRPAQHRADALVGVQARRVALVQLAPERLALGVDMGEPDAPNGVPAVLRTGQPELYGEIPDELLAQGARDEEHLRILREIGMRSAMIVPMRLKDRTVGVLSLVHAQSGRRFTDGDVRVAEDLARRAAVALENARLYTELSGR